MNDPYIIELRGCNFKNKGDVLMAESVIGQVREGRPDIRLVSRTMNRRGALADSLSLGRCLSPRYSARRSALKAAFLDALGSAPLAGALDKFAGIAPVRKIAGVIDVCGFAYGDAWGPGAVEADYRYYSEAAEQRKPIILMPKSFGPFSDSAMARKVRTICEMADLCFVRDRASFAHLVDAGVPEAHLSRFPDFTASAKAIISPKYADLAGRPAIVPNYRMIDTGRVFCENDYVEFLVALYRCMEPRYGKPFILVHDTGRDPVLAERMSTRLGSKVETVDEPVARVNKGIIANASFVYSDRLHGAISAALQGVPVCTMGWSHKYRYMLADFGLEWALIDAGSVDGALARFHEISDRYRNERQSADAGSRESDAMQVTLQSNDRMWAAIFKCLNTKLPSNSMPDCGNVHA